MPCSRATWGFAALVAACACATPSAVEPVGDSELAARADAFADEAWSATVAQPTGDPRLAAFDPLAPPRAGEWRTRVDEPSQTFADYLLEGPNAVTAQRGTLYLQPIGELPTRPVLEGDLPSVSLVEAGFVVRVFNPPPEDMRVFVQSFFGLPTRLSPPVDLESLSTGPSRVRRNHAQFDALEILEALRARLPSDAYSVTALMTRDIFVDEPQDYAFGYGLHAERVAVASFAQLDPQFVGQPRAADFQRRIRTRAYKLVAHEVGHTLGIRHCDEFACVMNGVAHLEELDAKPLALCPACLNKVAHARGVDRRAELDRRYGQLERFYATHDLGEARRFAAAQLDRAEKVAPAVSGDR